MVFERDLNCKGERTTRNTILRVAKSTKPPDNRYATVQTNLSILLDVSKEVNLHGSNVGVLVRWMKTSTRFDDGVNTVLLVVK
jgi:hypothetical protein